MFKNKKGSILAYSLLILAIMFAIIGSMSAVSVLEKKSAISSNDSTQAFQVADNGVQRSLKQINNAIKGAGGLSGTSYISAVFATNGFSCSDGTGTAIVKNEIESDKPYSLNFYRDDTEASKITNCNTAISEIKSIKSIGNFKTAARAVNVKVASDPCGGITTVNGKDSDTNTYNAIAVGTQCWLDKNLGATSTNNDSTGYGWYYQWGRKTDGHQISSSSVTTTLSPGDDPYPGGGGLFIRNQFSPSDWRSSKNDSLWQGVSGINNPCPSGFRVPKKTDWTNVVSTLGINNYTTAFNSVLKLTTAGYRDIFGNAPASIGITVHYWSSDIGISSPFDSLNFSLTSSAASIVEGHRGNGFLVRCIKN